MVEGLKSKVFKYVGYKKVGDEETCEASTTSSDVNNTAAEDNMFSSGTFIESTLVSLSSIFSIPLDTSYHATNRLADP